MVGALLCYQRRMVKMGLFWLLVATAREDNAQVHKSYQLTCKQREDARRLWSTCEES